MTRIADEKIARLRKAMRREQARVRLLIATDRADERAELSRIEAERKALEGHVANLQDTVVPPTREWLTKGDVESYTPRTRDGTVKTVTTVRRRLFDAVKHLQSRGAFDDRQAFACRWFRERYEAAQIERSAGVSGYGETIRGDALYGHLPSSEWSAIARSDYRMARAILPIGTEAAFSRVVLDNLPIDEAARAVRKRKGMTRMMVMDAATALADWLEERARAAKSEMENAR